MKEQKKIRIRTTPIDDSGKVIGFNLDNKVDLLEILSLSIDQEELYPSESSDFGVIVGRVFANNGLGIPNVRVGVFIQGNRNDLYPYNSIYDANGLKRYNLLRSDNDSRNTAHKAVGSFPSKEELLDNEEYAGLYQDYYLYTTVTNQSGDFFLVAPVGSQQILVDLDLSDIGGLLDLKPYDLIATGMNKENFDNYKEFSTAEKLESLPQIQSRVYSVDVAPFWGQKGDDQAYLSRFDIDLNISIIPNAIVMGSVITDPPQKFVNKTCRPRRRTGYNCNLRPSSGTISTIRKLTETSEQIEFLNDQSIDDDGTFIYFVPCNLKRKVTDEFGNLIPSNDPNKGIPTEAKIRMKIALNQGISQNTFTANYLVPNLYNNITFGPNTKEQDFYTVKWKQVYTIRNYIPRYQKDSDQGGRAFTGIKAIEACEANNSFPYNRIDFNFNPIYSVLCVVISTIKVLADIVNVIPDVSVELPCGGADDLSPADWKDCVLLQLGEDLNVINYQFFNSWVIGTLFFFQFRRKFKFKRRRDLIYDRYCDYDCRETAGLSPDDPGYRNRCKDVYIVDYNDYDDGTYLTVNDASAVIGPTYGRGLVVKENGELYYVGRHDIDIGEDNTDTLVMDAEDATHEKNKFLFATDFMPLGSAVDRCEFNNNVYFIDQLEATSFRENSEGGCLFELGNCVSATDRDETKTVLISQIGLDYYFEEDIAAGSCIISVDPNNINLRRYLCENFSLYGEAHNYTITNETTITNDDGIELDLIEDECSGLTSPINNAIKMPPYYFYFGALKNRSVLDKVREFLY